MPRKLPTIKYKKRKYYVDFRLGELRDVKTAKPIKFTKLKEGVYSKIKTELRGLRSRFWFNDYIKGIDD